MCRRQFLRHRCSLKPRKPGSTAQPPKSLKHSGGQQGRNQHDEDERCQPSQSAHCHRAASRLPTSCVAVALGQAAGHTSTKRPVQVCRANVLGTCHTLSRVSVSHPPRAATANRFRGHRVRPADPAQTSQPGPLLAAAVAVLRTATTATDVRGRAVNPGAGERRAIANSQNTAPSDARHRQHLAIRTRRRVGQLSWDNS